MGYLYSKGAAIRLTPGCVCNVSLHAITAEAPYSSSSPFIYSYFNNDLLSNLPEVGLLSNDCTKPQINGVESEEGGLQLQSNIDQLVKWERNGRLKLILSNVYFERTDKQDKNKQDENNQ